MSDSLAKRPVSGRLGRFSSPAPGRETLEAQFRFFVLKGHHPKSAKPAVRHAGRAFEDKRKQRKHL
jgi:hypothetical protein